MSRRVLICVGFLLLVCLDLGIPVSMLAGRAAILRNGTEVRLELATRDPRDLFRGEYSRLVYAIGNLTNVPVTEEERTRCAAAPTQEDCNAQRGQPLFVILAPGDGGMFRAEQVALREPAPGTLFIRGKTVFATYQTRGNQANCPSGRCFTGRIDYGIESWFGPQGVPAQVDRATRNQLTAVVRIDSHGNAVLADLLIDGKPVGR